MGNIGSIGGVEPCRALVASFPEGIALLDRTWAVAACNDAYLQISGGDRAEVTDPFRLDLIHEEDRPQVRAALGVLLQSPKASRLLEYRVRQKDGTWIWLEACATNLLETPGVEAQTVEKAFTEGADRGTETILVVEDEGTVRKIVCETLEAAGYEVIEARTPDEAVRLMTASKTPIDLLLTDVVMPGMNGKELHQKLDAIQPRLRVLYMSGYTDNVIVHHGILDAGLHFLPKPFTLQGLRRKVRERLD